jgi:rhodanese-related sulfurtransferase
MKIKSLFSPVRNMTADEARSFMEGHQEGSYTLLDVRQEREYEKARIPGAKLIPLPELSDRLAELDPLKPVIAY